MNQPIPDLTKPYPTARERAYAIVVILRYWQLIEQLIKLVDMTQDGWSTGLRELFPSSVPGGPVEHPQKRLERWLAVYADEINLLRSIRNRLVHAVEVDDSDLRGADFLARVILATLFGVMPTQVSDEWTASKISTITSETGL